MKRVRKLLRIFLPPQGWRQRRIVRMGFLPFTVGIVGVTILLVIMVTVASVPSFVSDPFAYRVESALTVSIVVLVGFNVLGTWLLGVFSARSGSRAARGQGHLLRQRLAIARRQMLWQTATIIILRLAIVAVLAAMGVAVLSSTSYFSGFNTEVRALFGTLLLALPVIALGSLHLVGGPVLRMFYSTALGAFGASTTTDPAARTSAALSARAIAGVVGIILAVWGVAVLGLLVATINQPVSTAAPRFSTLQVWPLGNDSVSHFLRVVAVGLVLIPTHTLIQVVGTVVLTRLTHRRLARRSAAEPPKGWLQRMAERYPSDPSTV